MSRTEPRPSAWDVEREHAPLLGRMYGCNSAQLETLWRSLPERLRADPEVRAQVALCFLRLADVDSARRVDDAFDRIDEASLLGARWAHRIARWLLRLYLRRLAILYVPLALVVNLLHRGLGDTQLLNGMYFKVWSNNSLGLRYILPLATRAVLRAPSPTRHRDLAFFGYIAALNCILDDGIALIEREIEALDAHAGAHPYPLWIQEMYLLLAMLYFYNLEHAKAEALHRRIEALSVGEHTFLFVKTMNLGSWLRLAATFDPAEFEAISGKLQLVLQADYDKRFALRTHSYRSLIAMRAGAAATALQELALANSIADRNPWGLEYCNHFGVTAKVLLHDGNVARALATAEAYVGSLASTNFQSSFVWEANLLLLKCLVAHHLLVPRLETDGARMAALERAVERDLAPYRGLSSNWSALHATLVELLRLARAGAPQALRACLARAEARHPGQFDELARLVAGAASPAPPAARPDFASAVEQATAGLRFNRELLSYATALRDKSLAEFTPGEIVRVAQPVLGQIFPRYEARTVDAKVPAHPAAVTLAPGITETQASAGHALSGFELAVTLDVEGFAAGGPIVINGYGEPLNFRKDRLASLALWKDATENAIREKRLHASELEREKGAAIAKTTQILAHDVRKPFSLIEGMLAMLLQGVDRATVLQFHDEVRVAIAAVNGMLADIMAIGTPRRAGAGAAPLVPAQIAKAVGSALAHNIKAMRRADVDLVYTLLHTHRPAIDEPGLMRVLANILANAVQAMHGKGRIMITTAERDGVVDIAVHNTGSCIPPEHLGRVFEPFFTHGKKDGTGLGLAIVGKIVADFGGQVACASDPQSGTCFLVRLPASGVPDADLPQALATLPAHATRVLSAVKSEAPTVRAEERDAVTEAGLAASARAALRAAQRSLRLLVCDDEELYVAALRAHLGDAIATDSSRTEGVIMRSCSTSDAALAALQGDGFDLFVLDVDLAGSPLGGFDLCREIRARQPEAIICIHSNRGEVEYHGEALRAGANLFLPKPMHRIHLLQLLLTAFEKSRATSAAQRPIHEGMPRPC
jgi:nitrogen-specific signal transduction histidine kinase/CheY-like chemotaxis protein